jgi:hypothetical protein
LGAGYAEGQSSTAPQRLQGKGSGQGQKSRQVNVEGLDVPADRDVGAEHHAAGIENDRGASVPKVDLR